MRKIIELYGTAGSGKTYITNNIAADKSETIIRKRRSKFIYLFMYLYFILTNFSHYRSIKKSIKLMDCQNEREMYMVFRSYIVTLAYIILEKDKNVILDEGIVQRWNSISIRSKKI